MTDAARVLRQAAECWNDCGRRGRDLNRGRGRWCSWACWRDTENRPRLWRWAMEPQPPLTEADIARGQQVAALLRVAEIAQAE